MRVLVHGNQYELGKILCPKCKCMFAYNGEDIKIEELIDYTSYYRDKYDKKVIHCPECRARLTLDGELI